MTVTIKDNTTEQGLTLYKYDSNRQLSLSGDISKVEYATFSTDAYTVYEVNVDETDSSLINIPNLFLDGSLTGIVFFTINSVDSELYKGTITILDREKPEDYTYTKTVLKNDYNVVFDTDFVEGSRILSYDNIKKIDWSKFGFSYTSGGKYFFAFSKLEEVDFRKIYNIESGKSWTTLESLFRECNNLKSVYWDKISTENATNFIRTFESCTSLETLDLSMLKTSNVTKMGRMFWGCTALKKLNLNGWDFSSCVDYHDMFCECTSLETLDLCMLKTSSATTMERMFCCCTALKNLNLSGGDFSNCNNYYNMFYNCTSLESVNLSNSIIPDSTLLETLFKGSMSVVLVNDCYSSLKSIDLSNATYNGDRLRFVSYDSYTEGYKYIDFKTIDLSGLNAPNITDMSLMFLGCRNLTALNLSGLNTTKVTTMQAMFYYCMSLTGLSLSGINTSAVTTMRDTFKECVALESLNLNGWDTSKVTNMSDMFSGCNSLTNLTLSNNWASNTAITELDLRDCPLNIESCQNVGESLATRTDSPSLYISNTSYSACTASELKAILNKGWRLFYITTNGGLLEYTG